MNSPFADDVLKIDYKTFLFMSINLFNNKVDSIVRNLVKIEFQLNNSLITCCF